MEADGIEASKEKVVKSEGLVVRFGHITALNSFSTVVPNGIVGLLGPNGAGKSTFIKATLGLVNADAGSIRVKGYDPMTDITKVRDMIGYMPEHDCLISSMNAVELVSFMGQISGMSSKDAIQRTHEVLDFVGIGEERYRLISSYSTGMNQRVKLAQAIVHDPEILFLDEPTNGMDPQGREEMLHLIEKIGGSGKTLLVSSHILQEVERVCEHVIIISDGALIKEGPIKGLIVSDDGSLMVKIRGPPESMSKFEDKVRSEYTLASAIETGGQRALVVKGVENSKDLFRAAVETGVQIRYLGPSTLTLEDVFVEAFRGVEKDGD